MIYNHTAPMANQHTSNSISSSDAPPSPRSSITVLYTPTSSQVTRPELARSPDPFRRRETTIQFAEDVFTRVRQQQQQRQRQRSVSNYPTRRQSSSVYTRMREPSLVEVLAQGERRSSRAVSFSSLRTSLATGIASEDRRFSRRLSVRNSLKSDR